MQGVGVWGFLTGDPLGVRDVHLDASSEEDEATVFFRSSVSLLMMSIVSFTTAKLITW